MGGRAIGGVRVNSSDALRIWTRERNNLPVNDVRFALVPWRSDKGDHGDLDVLVASDEPEVLDRLTTLYENPAMPAPIRNGNVLSVGVDTGDGQHFQIDFIAIKPEALRFARLMKAFGSVGIHLGRYARRAGFKLRDDGLYHGETGLLVTDRAEDVFRFLGFDLYALSRLEAAIERFDRTGDSDLDFWDLADMIASSEFFNPILFDVSGFSGKHRKRANRPDIIRLSRYFAAELEGPEPPYEGKWACVFDSRDFCEKSMLERAKRMFPTFAKVLAQHIQDEKERKRRKEAKRAIIEDMRMKHGMTQEDIRFLMKDNQQTGMFDLDLDLVVLGRMSVSQAAERQANKLKNMSNRLFGARQHVALFSVSRFPDPSDS